MLEVKNEILYNLLQSLKATRAGKDIEDIIYYNIPGLGECVDVVYNTGFRRRIDVTADSGIAMIRDICKEVY